jgi:multiple sugar transport system permease protein
LLDQKTFTLSLGLQFFQSQNGGTEWNLLMAASAFVIAPVIILFFFAQRLFIQGIALTGIK